MRVYSDDASKEFAELYKRADSGDKVKIYIQTPQNIEYTIEGNVVGINLCSLIVKNSVLDLSKMNESVKDFFRKTKEGTANVPLGDYIKNYEFLTGEKFTIEQQKEERKKYYDILKKKSQDPNSYLDFLYD